MCFSIGCRSPDIKNEFHQHFASSLRNVCCGHCCWFWRPILANYRLPNGMSDASASSRPISPTTVTIWCKFVLISERFWESKCLWRKMTSGHLVPFFAWTQTDRIASGYQRDGSAETRSSFRSAAMCSLHAPVRDRFSWPQSMVPPTRKPCVLHSHFCMRITHVITHSTLSTIMIITKYTSS